MLPDFIFYVFASVLLIAAMGVVFARNPIFSVLFLILAFFNAAGLFTLMGAEFLGLLLILVYVGAVAVMFLFVLMTIDIDFNVPHKRYASYLPVGLLVAGVLVIEIILAATSGLFQGINSAVDERAALPIPEKTQNIVAMGEVLFTDYLLPFQMAGFILLIAMVGAIVLTQRHSKDIHRQDISEQVLLSPEQAVEIKKVKPGQGLV